jgi:hypothetical protein
MAGCLAHGLHSCMFFSSHTCISLSYASQVLSLKASGGTNELRAEHRRTLLCSIGSIMAAHHEAQLALQQPKPEPERKASLSGAQGGEPSR